MSDAGARHLVARFLADTGGATAIEYSVIAAGVGGAVAATVWGLGSQIQTTLYNKIAQLF
ncbi:MAG: Flp family type IVb pilin [Xanthobacteraceae bacterium]